MARRAVPAPRLDPDIARFASVLADPSRAAMLDALLDGGAHTIGALARHAGITAATASGHLRRMVDEHLVIVVPAGRERRVRLTSSRIARLLESMATLAVAAAPAVAAPSATTATAASRARELRFARTCYDHFAGVVGVAITRTLLSRRWLRTRGGMFTVEPPLIAWLAGHGQNMDMRSGARRPLARACLDWSERTPHIAGQVGAALVEIAFVKRWVVRVRGSRAVRLTTRGRTAFTHDLGAQFTDARPSTGPAAR